jgi:hypothetical protein
VIQTPEKLRWYALFMDSHLSEVEHHRWQRLVADGLSGETALVVVLRARVRPPNGKES